MILFSKFPQKKKISREKKPSTQVHGCRKFHTHFRPMLLSKRRKGPIRTWWESVRWRENPRATSSRKSPRTRLTHTQSHTPSETRFRIYGVDGQGAARALAAPPLASVEMMAPTVPPACVTLEKKSPRIFFVLGPIPGLLGRRTLSRCEICHGPHEYALLDPFVEPVRDLVSTTRTLQRGAALKPPALPPCPMRNGTWSVNLPRTFFATGIPHGHRAWVSREKGRAIRPR